MRLVTGAYNRNDQLDAGTSGFTVGGLPLPLSGSQVLTVGKQRNGSVPLVIKADGIRLGPIRLSTLGAIGCICWQGVSTHTCGGTLFELDGSETPDCTAGYTAGVSVCDGRKPCAAVYGEGNAAAGRIGCDGLDAVNVQLAAGGGGGAPATHIFHFADPGPPGSAVLLGTASFSNGTDAIIDGGADGCSGHSPLYGPDQRFCTPDDPADLGYLGQVITFPIPLLTGTTATDLMSPMNGPHGAAFDCAALANGEVGGAALAGISFARGTYLTDATSEVVMSIQLAAAGPPTDTPTITRTPTIRPTPTITRTPTITPTAAAHFEVGVVTAHPGEQVVVPVTLHSPATAVALFDHQVAFDLHGITANDCTGNSELPKRYGFASGDLQQSTWVSVSDLSPKPPYPAIPDGTVVYRCTFTVAPDAPLGINVLHTTSATARGPGNGVVYADGNDGQLTVMP